MELYDSLDSIDQIRQALETANDQSRVMIQTSAFWQRGISENREDVKQFLIEIATKFPEARSDSIRWLSNFPDPTLASFILKYIQDEYSSSSAIDALMELGQNKVLEPDDPTVVKPLMELLALDQKATNEPVIAALGALTAISAIDLIASFLNHPHLAVRNQALRYVIVLSKPAHRDDLLKKGVAFLNDPNRLTQIAAAMTLKMVYPERFPDLDLNTYLKDLPFRKNE